MGMVRALTTPLDSVLARNVAQALSEPWNQNTQQVCSQAATGVASNSAGVMVCYNVASLENVTGLFAGDVRLYSSTKSSLPTGSSVRLNVDFGNSVVIRNSTDVKYDKKNIKKRDPSPEPLFGLGAKKRQQQATQSTASGAKYVLESHRANV